MPLHSLALPVFASLIGAGEPAGEQPGAASPWTRHTIDASSQGADGVRLGDADADGLPDIATGWEEGGLVRVYLNPGPAKARERWPAVTAGRVDSVEDAVLADLDGDGAVDVVSSAEGRSRTLSVHWAPRQKSHYLDPERWETRRLPASRGLMAWMQCLPLQVDGKRGLDLVAGGKGEDAAVGWFECPPDPRDLPGWRWRRLRDAGWIMSLLAEDMDGDGDQDIVLSDRRGPRRGCSWLENPGPAAAAEGGTWSEHPIGAQGREAMFLTLEDLDGDRLRDVLAAVREREVIHCRRRSADGRSWEARPIGLPDWAGTAKAVKAADLDGDGRRDIVLTCEGAREGRTGVLGLLHREDPAGPRWEPRPLSAPDGVKYDLLETLDLDGDGDLDILTCEETRDLGVIWHENPLR